MEKSQPWFQINKFLLCYFDFDFEKKNILYVMENYALSLIISIECLRKLI